MDDFKPAFLSEGDVDQDNAESGGDDSPYVPSEPHSYEKTRRSEEAGGSEDDPDLAVKVESQRLSDV